MANPRLVAWRRTLSPELSVDITDEGPDGAIAEVIDKSAGVVVRELPTRSSRQVRSASLNSDIISDATRFRYCILILAPRIGLVDGWAMIDDKNITPSEPNGQEYIDGNFAATFYQGSLLMSLTIRERDRNPFYMRKPFNRQ